MKKEIIFYYSYPIKYTSFITVVNKSFFLLNGLIFKEFFDTQKQKAKKISTLLI